MSMLQSFWLPRPLHRRVQHESSRQAEASGKVVERARHTAPLRPAEGILRLRLKLRPPRVAT